MRGALFPRIHQPPAAFLVRRAGPQDRDELPGTGPGTFFTTPHHGGCPAVLARLSRADLDEMTES